MNLSLFPRAKQGPRKAREATVPAPCVATTDWPLVVGIDPGASLHGVALLRVSGLRASFVEAHHLDTDALVSWLRDLAAQAPHVAIETAHGVHAGIVRARGAQAALSIARASVATTRADGVIEGVSVGLGIPTMRATALEWRAALAGGRQASDAMVAAMVPRLVSGWPTRSNAHTRDAAGVAVFCARRAGLRVRGG